MDRLTISILVAMSGPSGLFGPSTRDCALLAADEINQSMGGLLGSERGLATEIMRYGPLIEENTLLGIGGECSKGIYSSSGYFTCLETTENRIFMERYTAKFGDNAPMLNVIGQSCVPKAPCMEKIP